MSFKIYNTLGHKIEDFIPYNKDKGMIKMEKIKNVKYDSDILDENIDIINELIDDGMTLGSAISYVLEVLIDEDDDDDYDERRYLRRTRQIRTYSIANRNQGRCILPFF